MRVRILDDDVVPGQGGDVAPDALREGVSSGGGIAIPKAGTLGLVEDGVMGRVDGVAAVYIRGDEEGVCGVGGEGVEFVRGGVGAEEVVPV